LRRLGDVLGVHDVELLSEIDLVRAYPQSSSAPSRRSEGRPGTESSSIVAWPGSTTSSSRRAFTTHRFA